MAETTTISIDAMGGDHGPPVVVPGVARHADLWRARGVRFLLHGDQARIEAELAQVPSIRALCEIRHTDKVIGMDAKPAHAMRRGAGTSLWNALESVRDGEAQAAVSSGNTGALMAIARLILRMVGELKRPALVGMWPTLDRPCSVLDVGANVDCDAERLVEFAIMGDAFHRALHRTEHPSIALLSNGREEQKGSEAVRAADRLLRENSLGLNYQGFVEGDDLSKGVADVVVTDGFVGNVALKTAEGIGRYVAAELRAALTATLVDKIGAAIASGALRRLRDRLDPSSVDGGPLLGLNGVVVKSHGGTNAKGFGNAIRVAVDLAQSECGSEIQRNLQQLTAALTERSPGRAPAPENSE
ncbi:MAG: phosphate acyltransferase PlsX [Caulobacteraceae bacterium]|nr:phosphate acyltransferase PlsX [Caulobacteraceae bacterium]